MSTIDNSISQDNKINDYNRQQYHPGQQNK
jgi:hypothetical protein